MAFAWGTSGPGAASGTGKAAAGAIEGADAAELPQESGALAVAALVGKRAQASALGGISSAAASPAWSSEALDLNVRRSWPKRAFAQSPERSLVSASPVWQAAWAPSDAGSVFELSGDEHGAAGRASRSNAGAPESIDAGAAASESLSGVLLSVLSGALSARFSDEWTSAHSSTRCVALLEAASASAMGIVAAAASRGAGAFGWLSAVFAE